MSAGYLIAERDGPHVKLTMQIPEGHDHFEVELLTTTVVNGQQVQTWEPIHAGGDQYVNGNTTWERAKHPTDSEMPPQPLDGPRTYRALAYRRFYPAGARVRCVSSAPRYTDAVTVF